MALFIAMLIAFLYSEIKLAQCLGDNGTYKVVDIVKRQLNWNLNGYIVSSGGSNMKVDYLQPHVENDQVLDNQNYMAFTIYMKNGQAEVPNTGIFHFVNSDMADKARSNCDRPSMHAGAYYYFYNECPEDESDLVASGYCYQGSNGRGLVYNSHTFNNPIMTYVDSQYYVKNDSHPEVVNSYEQSLIRACFNSWKASGFQVTSWKWSTSEIPRASRLTSHSGDRFKRSSGDCNDCECVPVSSSPRLGHMAFLTIAMSFSCFLLKRY